MYFKITLRQCKPASRELSPNLYILDDIKSQAVRTQRTNPPITHTLTKTLKCLLIEKNREGIIFHKATVYKRPRFHPGRGISEQSSAINLRVVA